MAKTVGRLERPGERQYNLRSHLLALYAVVQPELMVSLSAMLERYREALALLAVARFPGEVMSYYWYPWHDRGWAKARAVANGWPDLRGYPEELEALADRWGLRCDWAPTWLHACLIECLYPELPFSQGLSLVPFQVNSDLQSIIETVRGEYDICIKVRYEPYPPVVLRDPSQDLATIDWKRDFIKAREKAKEEALEQLGEQMDEIDRRHLDRGYIRRDTEPELGCHIHWLYLRICPQPDIGRPWGYRKIADTYVVGKTTVRDAVLALACEMGITLPKLPAGPPPRFP